MTKGRTANRRNSAPSGFKMNHHQRNGRSGKSSGLVECSRSLACLEASTSMTRAVENAAESAFAPASARGPDSWARLETGASSQKTSVNESCLNWNCFTGPCLGRGVGDELRHMLPPATEWDFSWGGAARI